MCILQYRFDTYKSTKWNNTKIPTLPTLHITGKLEGNHRVNGRAEEFHFHDRPKKLNYLYTKLRKMLSIKQLTD